MAFLADTVPAGVKHRRSEPEGLQLNALTQTVTIIVGVVGLAWVLASAMRTVVIPRPERVWLTRITFEAARRSVRSVNRRITSRARREQLLAIFGPAALLILPLQWSIGAMLAFAAIFWGMGVGSFIEALELSGSSLTTLGFVGAETTAVRMVAVIEGLLGLGIVALMISFIPSLYATFSRREVAVGRLAVHAGQSPNPAEFILRLQEIEGLETFDKRWEEWEAWFVELGETHTSFPALVYFRSASPDRSWLTAAETALDTAALVTAIELMPRTGHSETMIRAGYMALRAIADFFQIAEELDPIAQPNAFEKLSISRDQFDSLLELLDEGDFAASFDADKAWLAFAGWRVNYDRALCGLADLVGDVNSHWDRH